MCFLSFRLKIIEKQLVLQGFVAENIEKPMVFQCSEAKTIEKTMVLQGFVAENIEKPMVFQGSDAKAIEKTMVFECLCSAWQASGLGSARAAPGVREREFRVGARSPTAPARPRGLKNGSR